MKKLFFLFIGICLVGLLSIIFLLLRNKTPSPSPAEKDYQLSQEKAGSYGYWTKVNDYIYSYPDFVGAVYGEIVFLGQIVELSRDAVTLSNNGKQLTLKNEDFSSSPILYDPLDSTLDKKLNPTDFSAGETVLVNIKVNLKTGKIRLESIARAPVQEK